MKIKIKVPDHIAVFLKENPNVGRLVIAKKFNCGDKIARNYAAIGQMMNEIGDLDDIIEDDELKKCKVATEYSPGQSGSITVTGLDLSDRFSEEGAIERAQRVAKINKKEWTAGKIKIGHWDTSLKLRKRTGDAPHEYEDVPYPITHWSVSIELVPNKAQPIYEAFEELLKTAPILAAPLVPIHIPTLDPRTAGEMIPNDAHFIKFGWGKETMAGNMDLSIIEKQFIDATDANLNKIAMFNPSLIYYVIGNDLMHTENIMAETPKGKNHLDTGDTRFQKGAEGCLKSLIISVDRASQVAPLELLWIPGNHDYHASWWLSVCLKMRYENHKHIKIDNGPSPKKARLWGDLLVGWIHDGSSGRENRAINMLPQFWPKEWGESRYRELHTGHKHKTEVTKFKPVFTVGGAVIRQCAGLTTLDFWHADNLWTDAVPACESFLWDKEDGISAWFNQNIDYLK